MNFFDSLFHKVLTFKSIYSFLLKRRLLSHHEVYLSICLSPIIGSYFPTKKDFRISYKIFLSDLLYFPKRQSIIISTTTFASKAGIFNPFIKRTRKTVFISRIKIDLKKEGKNLCFFAV